MTTYRYALAADGQVGNYPTEPTLAAALARAYQAVELGVTVTIFAQGAAASDTEALCTVTPPITPPSTSPEVSA